MELTSEQWNRIEPLIKAGTPEKDTRGRNPKDPRELLNRIFMDIANGSALAESSIPISAITAMVKTRCIQTHWHELAQDLHERVGIDIRCLKKIEKTSN
jgi:transposase